MSRTVTKRQQKKAPGAAGGEQALESGWRRLTQVAFGLTLVLVVARMTMQEILRNPWLPVPGSTPTPAMPGPATSIALDLLCCLPALLVLARRLIDPTFTLRFAWSSLAMFALAAWTLVSALWSSDRFAAIVNAFHWACALALLWSTAQLVHSWLRLRLVAAVSVGLLMVLLVQGYYYRFVDLPDLQNDWRQHHGELLAAQGANASSTETIQIEKNILGGVPTGFNVSRNTYAAVLVLLMVIAAGVVLQRIADGDAPGWWIPVAAVIALGLFMLYRYVQSKTAFATPVIATGLLAWLWLRRNRDVRHPARLYWTGVGAFVLIAAAIVGHGLKHGTLFHVSLTFRWEYWVGAARIFVHRPWLGTGWANFGSWYTAYRLPQAAEEPADPHNFLVRAFVELGVVGGILMLAWMLRLWWEWTAGAQAERAVASSNDTRAGAERSAAAGWQQDDGDSSSMYSAFPFLITLSLLAIAVNAAVSIDWTSQSALIIVETFKRLLFAIAFLLGVCVVAVRAVYRQELDDRPAPWILTSAIVGLGLFLLHNLIDFSMFEIGPMFFFALLAGAVLGLRLPAPRPAAPRGRLGPIVAFIVAGAAWLVAAGALWVPILQAESLAQDADEEIRTSKPPAQGVPQPPSRPDPAHIERAMHDLLDAWRLVPYNADYAFRAEQAALLEGAEGQSMKARQLLDQAIATDPRKIRYLVARVVLESSTGDDDRAARDYEQILQLDPHNLELRAQYASLLDRVGHPERAVEQYKQVIQFNDALAKDEIRRLSDKQVEEIRRRMTAGAATHSAQ